MDVQQVLIETIRLADRAGANALLKTWAAERGDEHLIAEILEPAIVRMGAEWQSSESFTLAQMYVAAKVAEDVLTRIALRRSANASSEPAKGPVVIGNIEDDFHALGRRLVGMFLRTAGWIVHDLGNDVPSAAFVDKAVEVGARVIGVSAMVHTTARGVRRLRAEIDHRGLAGQVQLAVGGAVFQVCPELAEEVGADGTAPNALGAAGLFSQLWGRAVRKERDR